MAFAAALFGIVDHAVAGDRAVAEHIKHQRHAAVGGVFQAGAHAFAGAEIADFAGGAVAGVVIKAAHGHGAGAGQAVDHHFHDGGGFAVFAIAAGTNFRACENGLVDAGDDQRFLGRVEIAGHAIAIGEVGAFQVSAADHLLDLAVAAAVVENRLQVIQAEFAVADAINAFQHGHGVVLGEQADQFAGIHQAGHVAGPVHLGGALGEIHQRHGGHGVAAGIGIAGTNQG